MAGRITAVIIAMIASTQITSRRVKPSSPRPQSTLPIGDVSRRTGPPFDSIGAVGHDVVGPMLPGHTIDVGIAPGIGWDDSAFQIRTVPRQVIAGTLHQH